nr:T9SS type A sorting domain-containing protein [Bacteroidota bacterium]
VQDSVQITNENFVVFGDNNLSGLKPPNEQNLHQLKRVWLAQITGEDIKETPLHFRLELHNLLSPQFLERVKDGQLKMWMLHDPYANNGTVSDFDNGYVEHYTPFDLEILPDGKVYAHFKDVYFDEDVSSFDQFTFAVGPEMLLQVRYTQWQCTGTCFDIEILITGGQSPYIVKLFDESQNLIPVTFDPILTELYEQHTYTANVCATMEYLVKVVDDNNALLEYTFQVNPQNYTLDLGPDQFFSETLTEILLDAGQGIINDPEATYQWFFNENQIGHYESSLWASEAGNYKVIVTTSDMACQLEDDINLSFQLNASVTYNYICSEEQSFLSIEVSNGIPSYSTHILGIDNGYDVTIVHETNTLHQGIPSGSYEITVSDSAGSSFQVLLEINPNQTTPLEFDPVAPLSSSQPTITLDAIEPFGNNPNHIYAWYHDNLLISTSQQLEIDSPGHYSVIAYDSETECEVEANILIDYIFEVTLETLFESNGDCRSSNNTLNIYINFGYENFITILQGNSGTFTYLHSGDFTISAIPYGEYIVTVTDNDGTGHIYQETILFENDISVLELDIYTQLIDICESCTGQTCELIYGMCPNNIPSIDFNCPALIFTLDASVLIDNNPNVTYEWYLWNDLITNNPELSFEKSADCYTIYQDNGSCNRNAVYSIIVTDTITGCTTSQNFAMKGWCPVIDTPPALKTYTSTVYPNPANPDVTFYYEVGSQELFGGTVQIFNVLGQILYTNFIQGNIKYTLPYNITSSGTYFIRTTTADGTILVDRVIIK